VHLVSGAAVFESITLFSIDDVGILRKRVQEELGCGDLRCRRLQFDLVMLEDGVSLGECVHDGASIVAVVQPVEWLLRMLLHYGQPTKG